MVLVERLERRRKVLDDALSELSHVYALLTARLIDRSPEAAQAAKRSLKPSLNCSVGEPRIEPAELHQAVVGALLDDPAADPAPGSGRRTAPSQAGAR